ncbi:MAG TPA: SRPBCC family protein [Acidimicrobiales bacterium]|nr:SRPBCC family protein [Acidimicrobiales bacterium]
MTGEARTRIAAPPEAVYDLVADVPRMGEWSPETTACQWLDGATGPAVGVRFKGTNRVGPVKWSTKPRITAADRGKEFAFDTGSTRWRYRFEAVEGGTEVTESYESHKPVTSLLSTLTLRAPVLQRGLEHTLERLKAAAEGA